ncbi:hypothetical protein F5Y19DRAFT_483692 [Xylariaceae sp. FL1651]|nr:hypothetical protein F5Y19DRAFT_483692 [Xylariaceae sp. FL1651]
MSRLMSSGLRQQALAPTASPKRRRPLPFPLHPTSRAAAATSVPPRRRQFSTAAPVSAAAAAAASALLSRFAGQTRTAAQVLDGNQLQKLSLTLNRRALYPGLDVGARPPPDGTAVPRGYHLVYFTPGGVEDAGEGEGGGELGADGSGTAFNAPAPFTRRMWAGGQMRWVDGASAEGGGGGGGLRVGDEVEERTRLLAAVPKRSRDGSEMVLVEVEKEFLGPRGLALVDRRSWIFRPEATGASPAAERPLRDAVIRGPSTVRDVKQDGAYPQRHLRWSPVGLFRFSALTFNGHKIHYDPTWSTTVEGHPACVVHGPLNLINMLDYWRDHCGGDNGRVREITYRATAPLYAGETYQISGKRVTHEAGDEDSKWEVLVEKDGKVCMKANILAK